MPEDRPGWSVSVAGTTQATVDKAAVAGKRHVITGIQASSDRSSLVQIVSPAGTTIWRKRFTAAFSMSEEFDPPLQGGLGQLVRFFVNQGTALCEVNGQGYTIGS